MTHRWDFHQTPIKKFRSLLQRLLANGTQHGEGGQDCRQTQKREAGAQGREKGGEHLRWKVVKCRTTSVGRVPGSASHASAAATNRSKALNTSPPSAARPLHAPFQRLKISKGRGCLCSRLDRPIHSRSQIPERKNMSSIFSFSSFLREPPPPGI